MSLKFEFDPASKAALEKALKAAPSKTVAGIGGWVKRSALRVERQAKQEVPVQDGILQNSINTAFGEGGMEAKVKPTAKYALYVHEGTGIYGPKKRPITPKRGSVMSWETGGRRIFARSIKGQRANPFMKRAYDLTQRTIEADANKTLTKIVESI